MSVCSPDYALRQWLTGTHAVLSGKHAREKRKKKENKYKQHSRVRDDMDPLDELLLKAERANNPEKFLAEEMEAKRQETR